MKTALKTLALTGLLALSSCEARPDPRDKFFSHLSELCGFAYEGQVVESSEPDEVWRNSTLMIYVDMCTDDEIRIPLHVGEDISRTWIISKTDTGLRLMHDHRHEDGTPDEVTMYGGNTVIPGIPTVQAFPADDFSKTLFRENGLYASIANTWILMIEPGEMLSYRLERPGRTFQVNFDLSKPLN